ncbi:MAG: hypothetical protein M3336_05100 [Chloroflexota bacterium]|nr:hypothetical protein [Chloroflexota bacterium]
MFTQERLAGAEELTWLIDAATPQAGRPLQVDSHEDRGSALHIRPPRSE